MSSAPVSFRLLSKRWLVATGRGAFTPTWYVDHAYFFELRDGKITSYHAIRDDLGLLRQLGVVS